MHRRIAATFFGLLLIVPVGVSVLPQKTDAQWEVHDIINYVVNSLTSVSSAASAVAGNALVIKGYALDPLAWAIAKSVLNSVIASTVKWINSGFSGSPAFVTNINSTLQTTSNSVANSFIQQLSTNGSIQSPFQSQVAAAVSSGYNTSTNGGFFAANPYTLNQSSSNPAAFLGLNGQASNFSAGGFNAWFSAIENPQNNPYGATILASNALNAQVSTAQKNVTTEATWGNGFLSQKGNCNAPSTSTTGGTTSTSLSGTNTCANANIQTPGTVLANTTYKALGSNFDQLVTASQFGQIVNALVGQFTNAVLGSGGLLGTSQPSAGSSNGYVGQIAASTAASTASTQASFLSTLSTQVTALQTFQTQWTTINNAALAAQTALTGPTNCYPAASTTAALANTVRPTIAKAATELSDASISIASLQKIQTEATPAPTLSTTAAAVQEAQASSDYSTLLTASTLPSQTDLQYAQSQSVDTGTAQVQSLYTQLNQLAQATQTCSLPPLSTS